MFFDEYPDQQYLIRFTEENYKGVYGIADDGHAVYMDLYSGVKPESGDAWYCNLVRKDTDFDYFYIANPVYKVEAKGDPLVEITAPVEDTVSESSGVSAAEGTEDVIEGEIENVLSRGSAGFVAIGDDTIYSPGLTAARYTVYRSFNGEYFEIIPDDNGNIPCTRNSIALESLDDILDCEFPIRLNCVMKDDRILLNLAQ